MNNLMLNFQLESSLHSNLLLSIKNMKMALTNSKKLFAAAFSLLFALIFVVSCSGSNKSNGSESNSSLAVQVTEAKNDSGLPSTLNSDGSIKHLPPRVDSILEFTSMVTNIYEDSKGNFWFGSHKEGVCRWDGKNYTYFTVNQGLPNTKTHYFESQFVPAGNQIRDMREDQNGDMLFATGEDISKFNGKTFTTIFPEKKSIPITESYVHSTNGTRENWQKELDKVWFGAEGRNGAFRYDGTKLEHLTFPIAAEFSGGQRNVSNDLPYGVYSLFKDREGNIWFGTSQAGIMRYDGNSIVCINENEEKGIVRRFFQDKSGRIWIANNKVGLCYFDGKKLENFSDQQDQYTYVHPGGSQSSNAGQQGQLSGAQSIEQDADGNLWFGSYGSGLWRFDGKIITHFTTTNGLPSNTVKSIYKDKRGKLWFGIGRGTVYGFNATGFERFDKVVKKK